MAAVFKPLEITDPRFPYAKPDGTEDSFDPWEFSQVIEEAGSGILANADAVRQFLGYPTSDDLKKIPDGQPKPPTIPLGNCQQLQGLVLEFIAGLDSTKKKLEASRKLSALGAR